MVWGRSKLMGGGSDIREPPSWLHAGVAKFYFHIVQTGLCPMPSPASTPFTNCGCRQASLDTWAGTAAQILGRKTRPSGELVANQIALMHAPAFPA